LVSIVTLAAAGVFHCLLNDLAGGGGSDVGNGRVLGAIVTSNGNPAANTQVLLIPHEYNLETNGPLADTLIDTTDAAGVYSLRVSKGGMYNILAVQFVTRMRLIITNINVIRNDTVYVPVDTLREAGSIKVMLPDSVDAVNGYVFIPGTTIAKLLSGSSSFIVLDSVPAGVIPAVSYSTTVGSISSVIRYNVRVASGDTVSIMNPFWKYARQLCLNTTASGASVAGNVHNFPVLVRLTSSSFNFAQAKASGADIRFTKPDNTFLRYEIDQWDSAQGTAAIWVKADTVLGSSNSQYIEMYWGNSGAADSSNSAAVFDTSSGFEGVWHLDETSGTLARDASHNGFSGIYRGGLPRGESGPTGICQNIARPDTDYVDMGNVLNPGMKNFAIGVWLKRRALGTQQALIAKTNGGNPSAAYGYLLNFDASNLAHLYIATGSGTSWYSDSVFEYSSNLTITDSVTWHYMFAVVDRSDNALCKMYIDGIDRTGVVGGDVTCISAVSNTLNLHIGTESDDNFSYSGSIGEVTVAFTVRSADWVKLSYMNQKEQDALVKW
jgi:hypothetical protein